MSDFFSELTSKDSFLKNELNYNITTAAPLTGPEVREIPQYDYMITKPLRRIDVLRNRQIELLFITGGTLKAHRGFNVLKGKPPCVINSPRNGSRTVVFPA